MNRTRPRQRPEPIVQATAGDRSASTAVEQPISRTTSSGWLDEHAVDTLWTLALIAIAVVVALELGAANWYTGETVTTADGVTQRLPNTFASIDHPFHIAKERTVLDALRDGEFPRWIANHQGGYPAEFYPLGADVIVAAGWGIGLGFIPLEVVHKLVVIAVLLIPPAAYWAIAHRDRLPISVAVIATLLHLFVPGSWMAGGPDELLRMGMWPNVFAAYLTLPLLIWSADYLRGAKPRGLALSAVIGSLAIYTNPRATIAAGTVLLAVAIVIAIERRTPSINIERGSRLDRIREPWARLLVSRLALIAGTVGLLSAALLVPLRAHQQQYEFIRFVEFDRPGKFVEYLGGAMPLEIVALGLVGIMIAWRGSGFYSRVVALWLPLGLGVILVTGSVLRDISIFAQLEGPRLIPNLRLPLLLLAAIAIQWIVAAIVATIRKERALALTGVAAVALTAMFVLTPISTLSADERGLPGVETTDQPAFAAIAASAEAYQRGSTPEDRALVIGSPISDHASFWLPALTGANSFHSAWIWYWKTPDYADRTRIADIDAALDLGFLRRHAITYVLIATSEADLMNAAQRRNHLMPVEQAIPGGYAIIRVAGDDPATAGPVTVRDGAVASVEASREHLRASISANQPTEVRVAINEFPAWSAQVNGNDVPIRRDDDGYMLIDIPAGQAELELTYTVEPVVWLGRVLTALGVLVLIAGIVIERRRVPLRLSSFAVTQVDEVGHSSDASPVHRPHDAAPGPPGCRSRGCRERHGLR